MDNQDTHTLANNPHLTLGELVARNPAAAPVLHRHRLDFCCGGSQTVNASCREAGIDSDLLWQEITQAQGANTNELPTWTDRPLGELISYIIKTYHEPLRRELPELVSMAQRVEQVHAYKDNCPHGLTAHLQNILASVSDHLDKEENVLFPAILAGQGMHCGGPVRCMEHEHDDHGSNLRRTRELCGNFHCPANACTTWKVLYQRLESMEKELMDHIHLENSILFPRALSEH